MALPVMVSCSLAVATTGIVLEVDVTVPLTPGTEAVATTLPVTGLLTVTEQVPGGVRRAEARLVPVVQVGNSF